MKQGGQQVDEQQPTSSFAFSENKEEEGTFSLVDTSKGGFQHKKFGGHQRRFQPGGGRGFGRGRDAEDQSGVLGDQGIGAERERARQMRKQKQKTTTMEYVRINKNKSPSVVRCIRGNQTDVECGGANPIVFIGKSYGEDYHPNGHAGNFERVWVFENI